MSHQSMSLSSFSLPIIFAVWITVILCNLLRFCHLIKIVDVFDLLFAGVTISIIIICCVNKTTFWLFTTFEVNFKITLYMYIKIISVCARHSSPGGCRFAATSHATCSQAALLRLLLNHSLVSSHVTSLLQPLRLDSRSSTQIQGFPKIPWRVI